MEKDGLVRKWGVVWQGGSRRNLLSGSQSEDEKSGKQSQR